jgi:hypothetical protein
VLKCLPGNEHPNLHTVIKVFSQLEAGFPIHDPRPVSNERVIADVKNAGVVAKAVSPRSHRDQKLLASPAWFSANDVEVAQVLVPVRP